MSDETSEGIGSYVPDYIMILTRLINAWNNKPQANNEHYAWDVFGVSF